MPATALVFSWFLGSLACTEPEATRRSTLAYVSIVEFLDILGVDEVDEERLGDAGEGFVGANTVKGPASEGASASLPALRAVARVERSEWQRRGQR